MAMRTKMRQISIPAKRILLYIAILIMCGQIGLGILWGVKNFTAVPGFGDTTEYLELSDTFALDEYRPILFPAILRVVRTVASFLHIPYQTLLYLLQLPVQLL